MNLPSRRMFMILNCIKGMFCGVLVWFILVALRRYVFKTSLLSVPLWLLGPLILFPLVLVLVLRFQLPPLPMKQIKSKWYLWIPGFIIAYLPTVDILFFGKRVLNMIMN